MSITKGVEQIPPCEVNCPMDEFENAIRKIGVTFACEWFGHSSDSDFTKQTIEILRERSQITAHEGEGEA